MADTIKGEYYYGMGRRKTAVARVRLFPNGDGSITVNGKNAQTYFGQRDAYMATLAAPLRLLDLDNAYTLHVPVLSKICSIHPASQRTYKSSQSPDENLEYETSH